VASNSSSSRERTTVRGRTLWIVAGLVLLLAGGIAIVLVRQAQPEQADAGDPALVALGKTVYARECASCHGAKLEGQPDWQVRSASGRLPAPPHDANGHTWHHPDDQLFDIVRNGLAAYAGKDYQSDMPVYGSRLSDREIWAVLAFIKSTWPERIRKLRAERLGRVQP
jgi:mono/diheme cytochrome c family protein